MNMREGKLFPLSSGITRRILLAYCLLNRATSPKNSAIGTSTYAVLAAIFFDGSVVNTSDSDPETPLSTDADNRVNKHKPVTRPLPKLINRVFILLGFYLNVARRYREQLIIYNTIQRALLVKT